VGTSPLVATREARSYFTTSTILVPFRPKTSGWYISLAFKGGTTKVPMVVARAR